MHNLVLTYQIHLLIMLGIVIPRKENGMNKRIELNSRRRIFIVDIENAVGCGLLGAEDVVREMASLEEIYSIQKSDLVVMGVSHGSNVFPAHAWKGARIVLKRGHDGADIALKKVLSHERLAERFEEVVIVSGDGIFAEEAEALRKLGVGVTIHADVRRAAAKLLRYATYANLTKDGKLAAQFRLAA